MVLQPSSARACKHAVNGSQVPRHPTLPYPPHVILSCSFAQCDPAECKEMEAQYGLKPYVQEREAFAHRFLMVVDGNSFSSRRAHGGVRVPGSISATQTYSP